jgi:hypothetical protein
MLTITNKALVDEIFAAKLPRSRDEVIREIYPEATQDRNGRYHAPYDGYECPLTGVTFRAGEYLPMDEPDSDDTFPVAGRAVNYPAGRVLATGELVKWEGTRGQIERLGARSSGSPASTTPLSRSTSAKSVVRCSSTSFLSS